MKDRIAVLKFKQTTECEIRAIEILLTREGWIANAFEKQGDNKIIESSDWCKGPEEALSMLVLLLSLKEPAP